VHATELSGAAVRWARRNARSLGLERVQVYEGSLLDPLPPSLAERVDLMVANLPYMPPGEHFTIGSLSSSTISGGGEDGLALHRRLARAALRFLRPGAYLQLQMLRWQWDVLSPELERLGFRPDPPRVSEAFAICSAQLEAA
jgi:release factor glutamine methyltransferase